MEQSSRQGLGVRTVLSPADPRDSTQTPVHPGGLDDLRGDREKHVCGQPWSSRQEGGFLGCHFHGQCLADVMSEISRLTVEPWGGWWKDLESLVLPACSPISPRTVGGAEATLRRAAGAIDSWMSSWRMSKTRVSVGKHRFRQEGGDAWRRKEGASAAPPCLKELGITA